jgi:hypothetical protein
MQSTIGQRIKFLLDHFGISARKLSRELGVPESNTQNYLPPNPREPGAYYLERLLLHFESVDAHWLLTGDGDPWVRLEDGSLPDEATNPAPNNKKYTRSQIIGHVAGDANQNQGSSANEAAMQREIELLKAQLADKERTIQILLSK